jgi:hypothetical protein
MPETKLQSAAYFQPSEEDDFAASDAIADQSTERTVSKTSEWQRASTWVSVIAAGAVVLCLAVFAVSSFTGLHLPKSGNMMDWWLWLGGAKSDQTFDKFLKDTAAKNQRDIEANFKAPALQVDTTWVNQFNQSPTMQFNPQPTGGQFQSPSHR